ncbi:hypothetical protein ACFE04_003017 [Oxalis oulophora]
MPSTGDITKSQKIRHIVRIRQMLKQWRRKAHLTATSSSSSDVPAGHVAVHVGTDCTRFVIRASYLNHPMFSNLLVRAEEEYGFLNVGPLMFPCDEDYFEEVLRVVSRVDSVGNSGRFLCRDSIQRNCHVGVSKSKESLSGESWPLLRG